MDSVSTLLVYVIQGFTLGLVDKALPVNLKSIEVAKQLVICKLPFALKVFVAPFVDAHITTQKGLAVGLWLLLAVVASVYSSLEQSSHFFVPSLFVICSFIAISDIMVDNYALVSNYRAFCQVLGILLGRLLSASISLCYEFDLNTMFKIGLLGCVFCTLLLSFSIYLSPQDNNNDHGDNDDDIPIVGPYAAITRSFRFLFYRENVWWWVLHQIIPPIAYFHLTSFLPVNLAANGMDFGIAACSDMAFVVIVLALIFVLIKYSNPNNLHFFSAFYFLQAGFSLIVVWCYYFFFQLKYGTLSTSTMAVGYGIIMRIQDCFFYIFEIGEFHHYGRVAFVSGTNGLDNNYYVVGSVLTLIGAFYLLICWPKIANYGNMADPGWNQGPHFLWWNFFLLAFLFVCIGASIFQSVDTYIHSIHNISVI